MSRATTTFGMWLIAQHWTTSRYPCRCEKTRECWTSVSNPDGHPGYWCPCWGRTDLAGLPAFCCAPGHPIHAGTMAAADTVAVVELELAGVST